MYGALYVLSLGILQIKIVYFLGYLFVYFCSVERIPTIRNNAEITVLLAFL